MIQRRLENLIRRIGDGDRRAVIYCVYDGDRGPTEDEKAAAVEAYTLKHGEQPIIVLYWKGDHFQEGQGE